MGKVSLADIEIGMILGSDVVNRNGLVLLKSGQEITEKHLKILKMWGITEIDIKGLEKEGVLDKKAAGVDPLVIEEAKKKAQQIFKYNNLEHPFIKELYRLVTLRLIRDP